MYKYFGAYEDQMGNIRCEQCAAKMNAWEKISTEMREKGQVYVFRCKKCKRRIEVFNPKG